MYLALSNSLRPGGLIDPDVAAFVSASGATDTAALTQLVRYVKGESLWSNFRIYPMKSAQNAGSGATVYGLGGLTSNNMTLFNSPPWGASGISFNGTSQYGSISDFLGSDTLTFMTKVAHASATSSTIDVIHGHYDTVGDQRSTALTLRGDFTDDPYVLNSSSDGITGDRYNSPANSSLNSDRIIVAQWVDGGARFLWLNKVSQSLTLTSGVPQTTTFNSSSAIFFAAYNTGGTASSFSALTSKAAAYITGSLTTTQRETITDLIDAL